MFAVLFPEEDINGVNGKLILALYLADTFLNVLCELLISKQSKWNFIVSLFVEITEILICVVLAYRFATMASTLFFWIPIDIISFINWSKHPDKKEDELTKVRKLSGWAEIAVIAGIVVWTIGVGYLLTLMDLGTELFDGNRTLEVIVCYLDACASAVGICQRRVHPAALPRAVDRVVYLHAAGNGDQHPFRPVYPARPQGGLPDQHHLRLHQVDEIH